MYCSLLLCSLCVCVDDAIQGAYWGTAYAAYAMIYSPGYYVHTWNLRNKDMIRPLYVCCPGVRHPQSLQLIPVNPLAHPRLRMLLLGSPPPGQDGHPAGLVQGIRFHRQNQERLLVGMHGRRVCSVSLGYALYHPSEHAVSPTPRHLGILPPQQMLFPSGRDALLGQRAGAERRDHVLPAAEDHLGSADEPEEAVGYLAAIWSRYPVSSLHPRSLSNPNPNPHPAPPSQPVSVSPTPSPSPTKPTAST